jgi:aspartate/methionine/tyrosine aminotransferase
MDVLRRANELQAEGYDVLHCEVGQPETGAPLAVAMAAAAAAMGSDGDDNLGYTDSLGLYSLREKLAQHYARYYTTTTTTPDDQENGVGVVTIDPRNICITTGSSGAFLLAFTACFDVGDAVAVASAGYPCYRNILSALGIQVVPIDINHSNDQFKLTATELQTEVTRRAQLGLPPLKGLILSSPSNPTGSMLTTDELRELCTYTETHDIQFISDEIYHGITYDGRRADTARQFSNQAIVINSFSKYYSSYVLLCVHIYIALKQTAFCTTTNTLSCLFVVNNIVSGWRLGWMIVPNALIDSINKLQQNMFINAPTISQTAALHCWDDSARLELESHVEKYATNRSILLRELNDSLVTLHGCRMAPSDGGFYVYVDLCDHNVCLPASHDAVAMCIALLEEYHVAFTPGIDFEDPMSNLGRRRFRISYSQSTNVVQSAIRRFVHDFWPTWVERVRTAQQQQVAEEQQPPHPAL